MRGKGKPLPLPELGVSLVPRNLMEFYSINYFSFIGFICSEHYLRSGPCFPSSPKQRSNSKAVTELQNSPKYPPWPGAPPWLSSLPLPSPSTPLIPPAFPKKLSRTFQASKDSSWGGVEKNTCIQRGGKNSFFFPMHKAQACISDLLCSKSTYQQKFKEIIFCILLNFHLE